MGNLSRFGVVQGAASAWDGCERTRQLQRNLRALCLCLRASQQFATIPNPALIALKDRGAFLPLFTNGAVSDIAGMRAARPLLDIGRALMIDQAQHVEPVVLSRA